MMRRPGVELAFADRSGNSWLRSAKGQLSAFHGEPVAYYGLPLPVGWDIPSDALPSVAPQVAEAETAPDGVATEEAKQPFSARAADAAHRLAAKFRSS